MIVLSREAFFCWLFAYTVAFALLAHLSILVLVICHDQPSPVCHHCFKGHFLCYPCKISASFIHCFLIETPLPHCDCWLLRRGSKQREVPPLLLVFRERGFSKTTFTSYPSALFKNRAINYFPLSCPASFGDFPSHSCHLSHVSIVSRGRNPNIPGRVIRVWGCCVFTFAAMHLFGLNWHLQPMQRQMYQLSEDNTSGLPFPTDLSVSPVGNTGLELPERRGKDDSKLSFFSFFLFMFFLRKHPTVLHPSEKKVGEKLSNLGVERWHFKVQASLPVFVYFSSGFTLYKGLRGMKKDLHCNPMKLVVSGNNLFVPGGRKWDSLRDGVSKGWRGISHCVLLRKDMILSSPSLGWLSWQPQKARAYPTEPTAQL